MTQKNNPSLQTEHQNYPLPSQEHLLQDDVDNLSQALQQIDTDVHQLQQDIQTAEANAKAASLSKAGDASIESSDHIQLHVRAGSDKNASLHLHEYSQGRFDNGFDIIYDGDQNSTSFQHTVDSTLYPFMSIKRLSNSPDFKGLPTVDGKPLALDQDLKSLTKRLDDANDVYELIKAATQVMQSGGTFTPTAEAMYPDVTNVNVDTQWLLRFASVDASLTFTAGDLKDQTAHSGDILFYNTPSNAFILIPSAQTQLLNDAVAKAVSDAKADTALQVAAARVATETQALDLVNRLLPVGGEHLFVKGQAPSGYLKCDGAAYKTTDYPVLAEVLAGKYNTNKQAADTFQVPKRDLHDLFYPAPQLRHTLTENISNPYGCALADGVLYVVNNSSAKVQAYDASSGAHLHEFSSHISSPIGCAVHQGRLYVANNGNSTVAVFDTASQAWQKNLNTSGYQYAFDVCFAGAHYYVCNYNANTVSQFRLDGTLVRTINTSGSYAWSCAVLGERLYVSHNSGTYGHQISVYNTNTGACIDHIAQGFSNPYGLCIDAGKLYVADHSHHRVAVLDAMSGALLHELKVEGYTYPTDVAIEAGKLAVCWKNNHRVTLHDLAQPLEKTAYIRALPVT